MSGKASVFAPANQPIFDGRVVRNPTRVQQQGGTGYGGSSEFPFQYSWPNLVNYTASSPAIATVSGTTLLTAYYSLITSGGPIQAQIFVNGVFADSISFSNSGFQPIDVFVPSNGLVGIFLSDIGNGAAQGLWLGLTPLIPGPV